MIRFRSTPAEKHLPAPVTTTALASATRAAVASRPAVPAGLTVTALLLGLAVAALRARRGRLTVAAALGLAVTARLLAVAALLLRVAVATLGRGSRRTVSGHGVNLSGRQLVVIHP